MLWSAPTFSAVSFSRGRKRDRFSGFSPSPQAGISMSGTGVNMVEYGVSIRTIALTLRPTSAQEALLSSLQSAFNAACNYASAVAWERREFRRLGLQELVYHDLRERFGLLAQLAIRVIAVVADSY